MRRFVVTVTALLMTCLMVLAVMYMTNIYIDLNPGKTPESFVCTSEDRILIRKDGEWQELEIRGVNMGTGLPGKWSTDYGINKAEYLRWFKEIKAMGANTVRIYSILADDFYNAFYEFNRNNPDPLYLLQGVWVNDYVQNSHMDALDPKFRDKLISDAVTMTDVIHGRRAIFVSDAYMGSGIYTHDISEWVIGYILGVEWEDVTVAYTNEMNPDKNEYIGEYVYTAPEAAPFEAMLAETADRLMSYESSRYKQQRLVAFTNWATTDPFTYTEEVARFFRKCATVDVEHIRITDKVVSGQFASYHVYPYYQDYLSYMDRSKWDTLTQEPVDFSDCFGENGEVNTYRAYLKLLSAHHTMPVVISEFGVSTGRGIAQRDQNTGRNQGHMTEKEQGEALISCYEDIMAAGCAGGAVFSWQDEWFKRTWNTMHAIDMSRNPYWSDYQTNEQYFGLLSFDPGKYETVSYPDGDTGEWYGTDNTGGNTGGRLSDKDTVTAYDDGSYIGMKYDERYLYILAHVPGFDLDNDTIVLPLDITEKTGSNYFKEYEMKFEYPADFVLVLNGREDSQLLVQDRYNALNANYSMNITGKDIYMDPPDKDSPNFETIKMILQTSTEVFRDGDLAMAETFETGRLRYADANPEHQDYDSLSDFFSNGDDIEIRIPWQLLNFADPSKMMIHDDYYDGNFGIRFIKTSSLRIGLGRAGQTERIPMGEFRLRGWTNKVEYHERLKPAYYMLKDYWNSDRSEDGGEAA